MNRRRPALLLVPMLAACASPSPPPAEPTGALRALNVGRWTPTPADLAGPRVLLPGVAAGVGPFLPPGSP